MDLALITMSLPVDLTAGTGPQGWNLFACCIPKPAPEMKEEGTGKSLIYIFSILDKNSTFTFLSPYETFCRLTKTIYLIFTGVIAEPDLTQDLVDMPQSPDNGLSKVPEHTIDPSNNVHAIVTFLRLMLTFVFFQFIGVKSARQAIQQEKTTTTATSSTTKEPPTDTDTIPELSLD